MIRMEVSRIGNAHQIEKNQDFDKSVIFHRVGAVFHRAYAVCSAFSLIKSTRRIQVNSQ